MYQHYSVNVTWRITESEVEEGLNVEGCHLEEKIVLQVPWILSHYVKYAAKEAHQTLLGNAKETLTRLQQN